MKIVFFGTPDFAVESLKKIFDSKHEILAVVTTPDKQRGRGKKITYTPIKKYAIENNLKVLQPENLQSDEFYFELKKLKAELFIVVAFRILPEKIFTLPPRGTFNLHGSLLPKYRGAAPIQWAIMNGDTKTGLTTFFLEKKVDTGNIIAQKEVEIFKSDNFETLHDKLMVIGADLVLQTIELIENDNIVLQKQNDDEATPAPKITKEICKIIWRSPAEKIVNQIRGLSPYPAAYFEYENRFYKVFSANISNKMIPVNQIEQTKKSLLIGTQDYAIEILEIQPEGRKRMTVEEFLRGYSLL